MRIGDIALLIIAFVLLTFLIFTVMVYMAGPVTYRFYTEGEGKAKVVFVVVSSDPGRCIFEAYRLFREVCDRYTCTNVDVDIGGFIIYYCKVTITYMPYSS